MNILIAEDDAVSRRLLEATLDMLAGRYPAEEFAEADGDRGESEVVAWPPLRTAEVRRDHEGCAAVEDLAEAVRVRVTVDFDGHRVQGHELLFSA